MNLSDLGTVASSRTALMTGVFLAAAVTRLIGAAQDRRVEREHPPTGPFIDIEGMQLHYFERGEARTNFSL
jgi:hypothetical protein